MSQTPDPVELDGSGWSLTLGVVRLAYSVSTRSSYIHDEHSPHLKKFADLCRRLFDLSDLNIRLN